LPGYYGKVNLKISYKIYVDRRVAEGGIGGFVPPFHPIILQFAMVFEKKA